MIKVTKEVIEKCAKNLMFELGEGQADLIYNEFNTVLAQIDFLKSIPGVDQAEPMTFPYSKHQTRLREDKPTKPVATDKIIANSKNKLGTQIKLPKVVGNNNE
jgi:aspartyl/glutamyl-tRNA(Asn/Gln) amidotransferase C subunit